jgi:hypothetical protein
MSINMNPGKAFVAFLTGKQESELQLAFFASTYKSDTEEVYIN